MSAKLPERVWINEWFANGSGVATEIPSSDSVEYVRATCASSGIMGLGLLRQLVSGNNALREFDIFWCNETNHAADCKCFWEQCEAWAKADLAASSAGGG